MRSEFAHFDARLLKFSLKCFSFSGAGDRIALLPSIFSETCYFITVAVLEEILNWEAGEEATFQIEIQQVVGSQRPLLRDDHR